MNRRSFLGGVAAAAVAFAVVTKLGVSALPKPKHTWIATASGGQDASPLMTGATGKYEGFTLYEPTAAMRCQRFFPFSDCPPRRLG